MITNISNQSFADFAEKVKAKDNIDTLASHYIDRISDNETQLVTQYADKLIHSKDNGHLPDPRVYMRQNLLNLVKDSYALGIADGLVDLQSVQFSDEKTIIEFALSPDDKLQRDISYLQRDIDASQNIVRQTKTLDSYTKTLKQLQKQAQSLQNTQAIQTLNQLSDSLDNLKRDNAIRSGIRIVNQQIQKSSPQQQQQANTVAQQVALNGEPDTQDYLIKRAIEEKLQYLQNRKNSLQDTPPIALEEDSDFFKWYAQKRLVPIANRYQQGLINKNPDAKKIVEEYTQKINNGTITQAAKGDYTNRIVKKLLNIENTSVSDKVKRPIKRVQRVVATELAIAYNIGRLKTYLKAGIQYVTISTSQYSLQPCAYCIDTENKSEKHPISIASLLKNAYRNRGFDKNLNRPIEGRYLPNHPYCYCYYRPHPKKDPKDEIASEGIYPDPNAWKFILGAGLGVSLAFLAFALTTGRKIDIPETIPSIIPSEPINQLIGEDIIASSIVKNNIPKTIPEPFIKNIKTDARDALLLRSVIQELQDNVQTIPISAVEKIKLTNIINDIAHNSTLNVIDILDEAELALSSSQSPEYGKLIVDNIAKSKGLVKELYFRRFDKIADKFSTIQPENNIQKLAVKVQDYLSQTGADAVVRTANNIQKTSIDNQLQSISLLRSDLEASLQRVVAKTDKKQPDVSYINDLQYRLNSLDNFTTILEQQKQQLIDIKNSLKIINKPVIDQSIANIQALLATNDYDAVNQEYQNLLEKLSVVSPATAKQYEKTLANLKSDIRVIPILKNIDEQINTIDNLLATTVESDPYFNTSPIATKKLLLQQIQIRYETLLSMLTDIPDKNIKQYKKTVVELDRRIKSAQNIQLKRFTGNLISFNSTY